MKIELPLENWTELFDFVPRSQLKLLVPHIGDKETSKCDCYNRECKFHQTIGDRQFVSFVQFFLHKCGEVTLGRLRIRLSRNGNWPIVIANENEEHKLPLADMPIPENVKNFKSIIISNYGESVIAFLQEFQQNFLLENVNLCFFNCPDALLYIMTNFLPLFTHINSIYFMNNSNVLDQLQSEYSELTPMLTSAPALLADYNGRDYWFSDWLHIPRDDGRPRVLILDGYEKDGHTFSLSLFIQHIKKEFLEANQAVSFFIKLKKFCDNNKVESLTLENGQTREKLVIKRKHKRYDHMVVISRYPMGTNDEWIVEMSQSPNFDNRTIEFGG